MYPHESLEQKGWSSTSHVHHTEVSLPSESENMPLSHQSWQVLRDRRHLAGDQRGGASVLRLLLDQEEEKGRKQCCPLRITGAAP